MERPAMHPDLRVLQKQGLEIRKPHQMVPVPVGQNKIILVTPLPDEMIAEPPNPRTRIHNDNVVALGAYLEACGIAAVLDILLPGNRDRASRPPSTE